MDIWAVHIYKLGKSVLISNVEEAQKVDSI